jgi:hypothetical protein
MIKKYLKGLLAPPDTEKQRLYALSIKPIQIPSGHNISHGSLSSMNINISSGVPAPILSGNKNANAPMWESPPEIKAIPFDEEFFKIKQELKQEIVQEVFEEIFTQILDADITEQKEIKEKIQIIMDRMGYK